jgi:predicted Zn-dependent peptidase
MYKKTTLKNGLRIITVPQKDAMAATVLILVKTGSKYEEKKLSGISHYLEHMLFKGTDKRKTPKDVAEVLDKIGGDYNAFTGEECTGYYAKVDASHFDIALDWVSDIFLNSKIPDKEVAKERGVIIEEINMYNDNPTMHIDELWKTVLYGDQPAGWDVAGTKETVSGIKRSDIKKYIESQYVSSNTIVCVAGKIKEDEVIKKIRSRFGGVKNTKPKKRAAVVEQQTNAQLIIQYKDISQTNLAIGVRAYNISHPQRYTLDLMSIILGGMMSSRMFIEIREKMGAAYHIRTYNGSDSDAGALVTFAGIDNKKIFEAIKTILKEYYKLTKIRVADSELKKAKDYLKGKMVLRMESSDAQASFYGSQELMEDKVLTMEEVFKKIEKVTSSDIMRVAKDIFKEEKLNLAIIGPYKGQEQEFKKLLRFK